MRIDAGFVMMRFCYKHVTTTWRFLYSPHYNFCQPYIEKW